METDPARRTDPPALYLNLMSAQWAFLIARVACGMARPISAALAAAREADVARVAPSNARTGVAEPLRARFATLATDRGKD